MQTLALQLFDAFGERLGCTARDRELLADAALLHDIGYHISYSQHHKHSYHLILHAELLGMTPAEQVVVANVARYHRGQPPEEEAAELRSARSGASRAHQAARPRSCASPMASTAGTWAPCPASRCAGPSARSASRPFRRQKARSLRLELWGASRKSELLAKVAGVPVEIVAPDGGVRAIGARATSPTEQPRQSSITRTASLATGCRCRLRLDPARVPTDRQ